MEKNAVTMGTYFERKIKRRRELELAEARASAIAEFNALLDDWEKRRDEAREKGEPFDEPPPRLEE